MVRYLAVPQSAKQVPPFDAGPASFDLNDIDLAWDECGANDIDTMHIPLRRRFWPRIIISGLMAIMFIKLLSTIAFSELVAALPSFLGRGQTIYNCKGYNAHNVSYTATGLNAHLSLVGTPCNSYGYDIPELYLSVNYDTGTPSTVKVLFAANEFTSTKTSCQD